MNRPSGFVPIRFQTAGRILITLGGAAVMGFLVSRLTAWFSIGWVIGVVGLILVLVGLYLVYIVPPEPVD
ncbi:MAG: hypothetical protein PVF49_02215 [Anaerolineales bacterium]|jgi:hypothetical protein